MQKVDLSTWGGSKVRANLKPLWKEPAQDDAEFGTYQSSLVKNIENTNELIDEVAAIKGDLQRRPF